MDTLFSSLNPTQFAAVSYTDGPELVIAGAGSGKTRVLTYKIAYLISKGMKPWQILALTFTNKAAKEMKDRIENLIGNDATHNLQMGTFHSIFLRILRAEAEAVGLKRNFTIYDESDSKSLITSIVKELGLDEKTYKGNVLLSRIGMAKNNLITPDAYLSDSSIMERDMRSNLPKLGWIYKLYEQRCRQANAIDFDDMLLYTYLLFVNHSEICRKYSDRYRYLLVDEFQDTNYAQQCIVTLLAKNHRNVCVVGDDAQSIYAFRGANIDNILNFQNIFEETKIFKLEQNYRSTQNIVDAANSLISHNQRQIKKNVFSDNKRGDKVQLYITYSDKEEVGVVCRNIRLLQNRNHVAYGDMAILYRTNAQSRIFEDELRRSSLPYKIYGGQSFYQRKEIKDILAYFRLVANTSDDEALKRVINCPKRGIGNTTLNKIMKIARTSNVTFWDVVSNVTKYNLGLSSATAKKITNFSLLIQSFIAERNKKDVYILGKRIISESGLSIEMASDTTPEGKDRMTNVDEFVSGLSDFVDSKREEGEADEVYIDNFMQEVVLLTDFDEKQNGTDEGLDVDKVSLMTIHASKGLEFNTVFIVGLEENIFPSQRSLSNIRELEEERRLFYVAITRAKEHCYITCAKSRYQYGCMQFNMPSRFLNEINSSLLSVNGGILDNVSTKKTVQERSLKNINILYKPKANVKMLTDENNISSAQTKLMQKIVAGKKVEHQRFGIGEVLRIDGVGENEKAIVEFENVGKKTLLLKFARLKLV